MASVPGKKIFAVTFWIHLSTPIYWGVGVRVELVALQPQFPDGS